MHRRILIVDDLQDAANSLATLCELYGAETRSAFDGAEALEVGGEFRPHVILMDISMPKMSGYEAARRIRAEPWGSDTILVALTGWGRQSDIDAAHAAGFDGHLLKPVDPEALMALVEKLKRP